MTQGSFVQRLKAQPLKPECLGLNLVLPFISCVTLDKSLIFFVSIFSSLRGRNNSNQLIVVKMIKRDNVCKVFKTMPGIVNITKVI